MRAHWFSDHRDLLKWSVLLHLAEKHGLRNILWVPYLRFENDRPTFRFCDERVKVQDAVWEFFRDMKRIEALACEGTEIAVVWEEFDHKRRSEYSSKIADGLLSLKRPLLVFLDPDTGLAPKSPKEKHVTDAEVADVWSQIRLGDWMVLYQHAWRNEEWAETSRKRLAQICGDSTVEVARSEKVARDVAFLCTRKNGKTRSAK